MTFDLGPELPGVFSTSSKIKPSVPFHFEREEWNSKWNSKWNTLAMVISAAVPIVSGTGVSFTIFPQQMEREMERQMKHAGHFGPSASGKSECQRSSSAS